MIILKFLESKKKRCNKTRRHTSSEVDDKKNPNGRPFRLLVMVDLSLKIISHLWENDDILLYLTINIF